MKRNFLLLTLLVLAPGVSSAQEPRYTIQEIGSLGGFVAPSDVNDAGWVVGGATANFETHAFLWLPAPALGMAAGIHDLGTLGSGDNSNASAIDAAGRIVGTSKFGNGSFDAHAFLWEAGSMTDLGTLEPWPSSSAYGVNDAGDVAGSVSAFGCRPALWLTAARYGLSAGINELPTPPGWFEGEASKVNDQGQVIGYVVTNCDAPNGRHPYLWLPEPAFGLPAGPHDLFPDAPQQGFWAWAAAINDPGEIVGHRTGDYERFEPFIWRDGTVEPLPLPPGSEAAYAEDLNDMGQIVGASGSDVLPEPYRALLWENGEVLDLNDLISPGTGWVLEYAVAINRPGQIVGYGRIDGELRAVLLTPTGSVLEVPTLGTIGAALLALLLAGTGTVLLILRRRPVQAAR